MTPLLLTLAGLLPGGDAAKADMQRLQGTWVAVTERPGGWKQTDRLTFKGEGQLAWLLAGMGPNTGVGYEFKMTCTLDPSHTPKRFKLQTDEELLKDVPLEGIYAVEGDTLRLAFRGPGKELPKDFKEKPDSWGPLTFKRQKPTPKR